MSDRISDKLRLAADEIERLERKVESQKMRILELTLQRARQSK